jgi:hypothetical protein
MYSCRAGSGFRGDFVLGVLQSLCALVLQQVAGESAGALIGLLGSHFLDRGQLVVAALRLVQGPTVFYPGSWDFGFSRGLGEYNADANSRSGSASANRTRFFPGCKEVECVVTGNVSRVVVWIAVAFSATAGAAVAIVLLRGDPTYLIQARTRGGAPYGEPAPVPFPFRAFSATILVVSLVSAGMRAVSDDGMLSWPVVLAGYALFILNVIVSAAVGPVFPAFLVVVWFSMLLPGISYSEPIGDLLKGPSWVIWAFCLLALAARVVWVAFL